MSTFIAYTFVFKNNNFINKNKNKGIFFLECRETQLMGLKWRKQFYFILLRFRKIKLNFFQVNGDVRFFKKEKLDKPHKVNVYFRYKRKLAIFESDFIALLKYNNLLLIFFCNIFDSKEDMEKANLAGTTKYKNRWTKNLENKNNKNLQHT